MATPVTASRGLSGALPHVDRVVPQDAASLLTFIDTAVMTFRSANKAVIGQFTNRGHDYCNELPALLREAFGFTHVTDAELARITEQVRQSEVWIMGQDWK